VNWIATSLVAAACAAIAAPAGAVTSDQAFDAFRHLCADTGDDYAAVVAAADAGDWKPTEILANTMKGVSVTDKISRIKVFSDGSLTIFAWRGLTASNVKVSDCAMRIDKANFGDLQTRSQAWLGIAPQQATPQKVIFRFTDDAGAHRAISPPDFDGAAAGSGLEILTLTPDGAGVTLDLIKFKK